MVGSSLEVEELGCPSINSPKPEGNEPLTVKGIVNTARVFSTLHCIRLPQIYVTSAGHSDVH